MHLDQPPSLWSAPAEAGRGDAARGVQPRRGLPEVIKETLITSHSVKGGLSNGHRHSRL